MTNQPDEPQGEMKACERKYSHHGNVHPETVVDWFLTTVRHWFERDDNLFFGQRDAARAYLDGWIKTGEFSPDNTTL